MNPYLILAAYVLGMTVMYAAAIPLVYIFTYLNPAQAKKTIWERIGYSVSWPVYAAFAFISIVFTAIGGVLTAKGMYVPAPKAKEN